MSQFLGRSGWVMAVAIAALVAVPEGVRAQATQPLILAQSSIEDLKRDGVSAFNAGDYARSEQIWRRVIQQNPQDASAHAWLGYVLYQQRQLDAAVASYKRALSLNPQDAITYNNLGNALRDQGKLEEAIAQYRQAIALDPKYAKAYNNLGNALRDQGKLDEAVAAYRRSIELKNPQPAIPYNGLGLALYDQGKLEEAIAQYRQAIALDPKLAAAYNNLGIALRDQGKLEEAIAQYRQAIALDPRYANAYNGLGAALYDQKKLEEAIAQYRQAIALDPKLAAAYNNLGIALSDQGKLEEAIAQYRQAIALDPKLAAAYYNLGNALRDQGKLDEAIAQYRQAIALDPKYAEAYNNLGNALRDQGKLEEAIAQYRRGFEFPNKRSPATDWTDHTYLHNNLGYALEQQGNLEAAIAEYEKAVALDPKYAPAQNNLRAARERRNSPVSDDRASVPSEKENPQVALFRATVIVETRFGATGQDAGSLNRGAGWVVKREGNTLWIVTCRHNVIDRLDRPGTKPIIKFYSLPPPDKSLHRLTGELVQQDAALDIAVLKVTGAPSDIKPLVMAEESQIQFTGRVMAIGHPYNQEESWVYPKGDLASYNPWRTKFSFSAPIATGHSGGPVFDESDRLIGMVAEISDETSGAPDPNSETPDLSNATSRGQISSAIRIQPIREKLQTWGILP